MPGRTMTSPSGTRAPRRAWTRHRGATDTHYARPASAEPRTAPRLSGRWSLDADGRLRLSWSLQDAPGAS